MTPTDSLPFLDDFNAICGILVAVMTMVFGEHWILFAAFFGLNIIDYLTGCLKARINSSSNSRIGAHGILKKLGYWLMILVAFGASAVFIEIGNIIGVNLGITTLLGWYVLATLAVNEIRSITENFVEAGYNVPKVLVEGLEVAAKKMEDLSDVTPHEEDDKNE